jgi:mRNA interferase MazF
LEKNFDGWNLAKQVLDTEHKLPFFKEREVWWCSLGVNVGYEIYGKGHIFSRPVLVLRKFSRSSFLGVPLTSKRKEGDYYYPLDFCGKNGSVLMTQFRVMDSRRLSKIMGTIGKNHFEEIKTALKSLI